MLQPLQKMAFWVLKLLIVESPYELALPWLGICPREAETAIHTNTAVECWRQPIHNCQKAEATQVSVY